jgi:predicted ATPase
MLESILVRNFRTLQHCEIDTRNNLRLFIGKNGSGKSTIFDALQFLADVRNGTNLLQRDNSSMRPKR